MTAKHDERFPKSARLVSPLDFDRVFKTGIVASDAVLVIHACRSQGTETRIGLSISKRVGNSPVRNHWKRIIRESYRRQKYDLPRDLDFVVRPKRGAVADYHQVFESIARLCKQLDRRLPRT